MSEDPSTQKVIFVEYSEGRPHSVITENQYGGHEYYGFEWSEAHGSLYYHLSGCGGASPITVYPSSRYWCSDGVALQHYVGREAVPVADGETIGKRFKRPLKKWPLSKLFDGYETCEDECQYCSVCDDWFPTSDTNHPCDHIRWCDDKGWWSMPDERCPAGCEDCLRDGGTTESETSPMLRIGEGYGHATEQWLEIDEPWPRRSRWRWGGYHEYWPVPAAVACGYGAASEAA